MVAALGAFEYHMSGGSSSASSVSINIVITGGVGAGTVDQFVPNTFTVKEGQNVTLVIQNTDDNTHGLVMPAFHVNTGLIDPGQTERLWFIANQTGTFPFDQPPGYCTGGIGNACNSAQHMTGNMTVTA